MLIVGFPAGDLFQTNCYLAATGPGSEAVVVDPGQDALPGIGELCARHRLRPVAALLTHGHLDHIWSVAPLAGAHGIPAWIHPRDRHLLTDPLAGLAPETRAFFAGIGLDLAEPDDLRELRDGMTLELAGLELVVDHTPGHTPGHVTFRTPARRTPGTGASGTGASGTVFSGDLVFAGSVGRTDLPGGSTEELLASVAARFLPLPDDTVVLPGHGPETTVGRERATNPYLRGLRPSPAPVDPEGSGEPRRGYPVDQGGSR